MTEAFKHNDLAWVIPAGGHEPTPAIYRDWDGDGEYAYWSYFGTDLSDRAGTVVVVRLVRLTEIKEEGTE